MKKRGKFISLKAPGQDRFARLDTLGGEYSEAALSAVIAGEKAHKPRKKKVLQAEPKTVNLLVDIQAKLQAGKSAGYARWAKVFNLKQMAKTMNYLTENGLLEYVALADKAQTVTERYNLLKSVWRKSPYCGHRLSTIPRLAMFTQPIAEPVNSKKFLAEHEADILLHKAAKKAFDELGVQRLPRVKELQSEYAVLLAEKKKAYAEYQQARQEILTAKANVDRLLGTGEQDARKEKEHDQR